jgi:lipopolysaccharide exporter
VKKFRLFSPKGDLFATISSFSAQGVLRLGSSVVLTRLLRPDAYGVMVVLASITFVVELIADMAVTVSLVRHKDGDQPRYLNTAWTLRLARATLNAAIVFFCAPLIASIYAAPTLVLPVRVFSCWFIISALESMSFPLAIRRKNSRIIVYSELVATAASTLFTVVYCYVFRTYWGMVYGTLVNRLLMTLISYRFYPESAPKLQFDREAARELLRYTRFAMPSSLLTLALSQFDKIAFLRLFDLRLLGLYALAGNIAGPIETLITKISQLVLYPRCAHDFRADPGTFARRYYTENTKLFASMLVVPAAVGGVAPLLVAVLYDPRYFDAGALLQAFMLRAALLSFASPAEDMLIAAGEFQVILIGNVLRAAGMIAGSLTGYYLWGFMGFVYGAALSGLPPLVYYLWLQRRKGFLIARYEAFKLLFVLGVALTAYLVSEMLLGWLPIARIRI